MAATANYLNAARKANVKTNYLLEIDLNGESSDYDASKTIYLCDDYKTIESITYEALVLDWGGIDVLMQSNEGISSINAVNITLANERMMFFISGDNKFSDILAEYTWHGSVCRIYQWFDELTAKSDALLIFKGIAKQPTYDLTEFSFSIEEDTSIFIDLPLDIVSINDFGNAPDDSIGQPLPIVYGDDWTNPSDGGRGGNLSPCIETDDNAKTFYIAGHSINESIAASNVKIYLSDAQIYGTIVAANIATANTDAGATFTLNDDLFYNFSLAPKFKGSQYSSAITDWSNLYNNNTASGIVLSAGETFYLKFDTMPSKGALEYDANAAINISTFVSAVTGGSPYGTIKYYNAGYDAQVGAFSTGQNITGTGRQNYEIIADKSAHGTDGGQEDQKNSWTLSELSALEIGITVGAGNTITIGDLFINPTYVALNYIKPGDVRFRRKFLGLF